MTEWLLFDLGGVLVEFSGLRDVVPLLGEGVSEAEVRERWSRCPHTTAFELGQIAPDVFATRFVRDWGLRISPDRFLVEYRSWTRRLLPGGADLLTSLRPRVRLAALSNSNELHWDRNTTEIGVTPLFDLAMSSHQLGLRKPDPSIFHAALARMQAPAEAVTFFDDSRVNVAAAADIGLRAFHVEGVDALRDRLVAEGLL